MFDNNDDAPPKLFHLITACPAPPTHLSNLIDLAPAYLALLKYQIFTSSPPSPFYNLSTRPCIYIKSLVGSENLGSEENRTIKGTRYHPDMSQTCLHIEFLRGLEVDSTGQQGSVDTFCRGRDPSPSHQACPRRLSSPFMGLGLASYVRSGWLREARAASLTSLHRPDRLSLGRGGAAE